MTVEQLPSGPGEPGPTLVLEHRLGSWSYSAVDGVTAEQLIEPTGEYASDVDAHAAGLHAIADLPGQEADSPA